MRDLLINSVFASEFSYECNERATKDKRLQRAEEICEGIE